MTLRELSYAVLEETRNAYIVDDERIDLRLLDKLVQTKRAELISKDSNANAHDENLRQTMWVDMEIDSTEHTPAILRSTNTLPTFISNRFGPLLDEIRGENHMAYTFTVVPFDRIRWCGNGYFNKNNIFVSVHGKRVYLKSKNEGFKLIEKVKIEGIFEEPLDVLDANGDPQLTPTIGDYPITGQLFEEIKESIKKKDIAFMLRLPSDEVDDGTGDIIVG